MSVKSSSENRLPIIDSIRFLMAMFVFIGHKGMLPIFTQGGASSNSVERVLVGQYYGLVNGPASVIVFFVISGLCIHFSARKTLTIPDLRVYYSRRLLRIVLPSLAAYSIASFVDGGRAALFQTSKEWSGIYWSLIAETIYYLIYPGLLFFRRKFGWKKVILVSYIGAIALICTDPTAGNYPSFGHALNWIVGLPCWTLGCLLAERLDTQKDISARTVWFWRIATYLSTQVTVILRWHFPISIGSPWTLNVLAIVIFFWLFVEVSYYRKHDHIQWLESFGKWSFSLYLMHLLAILLVDGRLKGVQINPILQYLIVYLIGLVMAYVFYLVVEKPSHNFAMKISKKVASMPRSLEVTEQV